MSVANDWLTSPLSLPGASALIGCPFQDWFNLDSAGVTVPNVRVVSKTVDCYLSSPGFIVALPDCEALHKRQGYQDGLDG
jgi:hypothetical protein